MKGFATLGLLCVVGTASAYDSLRTEVIDGKTFVIHRVDPKETVYSISRRYGATVLEVVEANPSAASGIEVGAILKVPYQRKAVKPPAHRTHTVAAKETLYSIAKMYSLSVEELKTVNNLSDNALEVGQVLVVNAGATVNTPVVRVPNVAVQSLSSTHTVAASETLFSIAKQYQVTVEQLKAWNNLSSNELKIGQMLYTTQPVSGSATPSGQTKTGTLVKERQPVAATAPVTAVTQRVVENGAGYNEVRESGYAELIPHTQGTRKYLAYHASAKQGTILKVRNESTNREVFVRVAGTLPAGTGALTVIQLSQAAYDRLGATEGEGKFRAEVTYYK
ncbi:MAG: LysM peptidoglycan-binding domain-containing protein [Cyclobacteriaceae bacterium]|jgi:LysM repeat protein|nr:LysM peptidoglycan-binding domain-containing protein [Cyclobacteriaceae bacterium]